LNTSTEVLASPDLNAFFLLDAGVDLHERATSAVDSIRCAPQSGLVMFSCCSGFPGGLHVSRFIARSLCYRIDINLTTAVFAALLTLLDVTRSSSAPTGTGALFMGEMLHWWDPIGAVCLHSVPSSVLVHSKTRRLRAPWSCRVVCHHPKIRERTLSEPDLHRSPRHPRLSLMFARLTLKHSHCLVRFSTEVALERHN